MDQNTSQPHPRPRRIFKLLAVNVLILCAGLIALEFYLRHTASYVVRQGGAGSGKYVMVESSPELLIKYTNKGRRLIPKARVVIVNHNLSRRNVRIDVNSMGWRDRELPESKGEGELRVLVLGDSITLGDYLPAQEVYVERAEKYLGELMEGSRVEVINAGVGDVGLKEEVDILEEKGLSIQPDVVVVSFFLNDSRPPYGFPGELGSFGWLRRYSILAQFLYRELALQKWMSRKGRHRFEWTEGIDVQQWRGSRDELLALAQKAQFDWGAAWDDSSWPVIDRELDRLKNLADQYGFKTVLVAFPVSFQVYPDYLEDKPQRYLEERAQSRGFFFFDLLPLLCEQNDKQLFYDNCHPLPYANDVIGRALARFLKDEVLAGADRERPP